MSTIEIVNTVEVLEIQESETLTFDNTIYNVIEVQNNQEIATLDSQEIIVINHTDTILLDNVVFNIIEIGIQGPSGGGNAGFTDVISDVETDFYYYGGILNGAWKINRYLKADINIKLTADIVNNSSFADINTAWTNRATLVYT